MYTACVQDKFGGRTGYQIFVDRSIREGSPPIPMKNRTLKHREDTTPDWRPDEDEVYRNQYFYGGNLKGITSLMPYFKSINVNLLYLTPISRTPSSHHYDVGEQTVIDNWIGTWADFEELSEAAHAAGVLVCVDLVFNHMGKESRYFQEALKSKRSKYHEWFEWDEEGKPVGWAGFEDLPQCNKLNKDYQEYAYNTCEFYLDHGVDGIRLDLGESLPKEFLQGMRGRVKGSKPDTLIVSEMWELATKQENPQIYGDQVDSVMNYPLADAILRWIRYGNHLHFEYTWEELEKYPEQVQNVLWNFLDSHDTPRALNMLGADGMNEDPFAGRIWNVERPWSSKDSFDTYGFRQWEADNDGNFNQKIAIRRLKLASMLQYFMPGIPVLYHGTEKGITGYKDPFNRKPFTKYVWNDLPDHYGAIGSFRSENKDILADGKVTEFRINSETLLIARENAVGILVLTMNRTGEPQKNPVKDLKVAGLEKVCCVGLSTRDSMAPYSAVVYRRNRRL